jgi:hypothetical protein
MVRLFIMVDSPSVVSGVAGGGLRSRAPESTSARGTRQRCNARAAFAHGAPLASALASATGR